MRPIKIPLIQSIKLIFLYLYIATQIMNNKIKANILRKKSNENISQDFNKTSFIGKLKENDATAKKHIRFENKILFLFFKNFIKMTFIIL